MKLNLTKKLKFKKKHILIIPNPVSDEFHKAKRYHEVNNYIVCVARLVDGKGLEDLIEVSELLPNHVSIHIYGEGYLKNALIQQVNMRKSGCKIEFKGETNEIIEVYRGASLTVLTSYREGMPNVLLESISVGTPVISYDCPSGPSEIINGKNGILVPLGDKDKLHMALLDGLIRDWDYDEIKIDAGIYRIDKIAQLYKECLDTDL